mmetsp:Transcript_60996/g.145345  ORF Transcript_60996/g.145345 Transcript_60996/m.145345 type:complete len:314 (+) Transcript_60996:69-1010(+)
MCTEALTSNSLYTCERLCTAMLLKARRQLSRGNALLDNCVRPSVHLGGFINLFLLWRFFILDILIFLRLCIILVRELSHHHLTGYQNLAIALPAVSQDLHDNTRFLTFSWLPKLLEFMPGGIELLTNFCFKWFSTKFSKGFLDLSKEQGVGLEELGLLLRHVFRRLHCLVDDIGERQHSPQRILLAQIFCPGHLALMVATIVLEISLQSQELVHLGCQSCGSFCFFLLQGHLTLRWLSGSAFVAFRCSWEVFGAASRAVPLLCLLCLLLRLLLWSLLTILSLCLTTRLLLCLSFSAGFGLHIILGISLSLPDH